MASHLAQLPDGYEIRQLQPEHLEWVTAIVGHTMAFDSPIWSVQMPDGQTERAYDLAKANQSSAQRCIASGLSYGVFIKDWVPRHVTTKPGGELRWNFDDKSATKQQQLEQMDFPLVSVALSQDAAKPKPQLTEPSGGRTFSDILDGMNFIREEIKKNEKKGIAWSPPKEPKWERKVVKRSGTCTRADHTGKGLAKALAHFLMRKLAEMRFQGIVIDAGNDAVSHVWENPPAPYRAEVVSVFDLGPDPRFAATVEFKTIWVTLREKTEEEKTEEEKKQAEKSA